MKPSRRPETDAAYLREGRRHLARAQKRHPEVADPIDALLIDVETDSGVLTQNSVSVYRQEFAAILTELCIEQGISDERRQRFLDRVNAALKKRKGRPPEPRTSSKRRLDIPKAEARRILRRLARRATAEGVDSPVLVLGLVLYFAPRVGCRLCEWIDASIEGEDLVVRQAKLSERRAGFPTRRVPLTHMSASQREAIPVLLDLLALAVAKAGSYRKWHRAAAELLARSCKKEQVERVSFYAFRHIAIGVWAAAGLSPWQIAALAGHASIRTRQRHYNRGAAGWGWSETPVPDVDRVAALEQRASSHAPQRHADATEGEFVFETPPEFRAAPTRGPGTGADWRAHADIVRRRGESLLEPDADEPSKPIEETDPAKMLPPTFRR